MMLVLVVLSLLSPSSLLFAQDTPPAQGEPTAEEKAQANNPLADTKVLAIHYYFRPALNEVEGGAANTTWLRFAIPTWRILWSVNFREQKGIIAQSLL